MFLLPLQLLAEQRERDLVFDEAKATANRLNKPLLNAGCGFKYWRAIMESAVNMDAVPQDVPNFVLGSIEDMSMFYDKQFGSVFCAHVLEHVNNLEKAKAELERVADYQFIITPSPLFLSSWLLPEHIRVFNDTEGMSVLAEIPKVRN
jgi:hypothetical protein